MPFVYFVLSCFRVSSSSETSIMAYGFRFWPLPFLLLGCGSQANEPAPDASLPRYLALGDSYTIGESVQASERWPVQLVARLREKGVQFAEPTIVARTGWTTDELTAGIAK